MPDDDVIDRCAWAADKSFHEQPGYWDDQDKRLELFWRNVARAVLAEATDADGEAARGRVFEYRVKQVTAERDRALAALDKLRAALTQLCDEADQPPYVPEYGRISTDEVRAELSGASDPGVRVDGPDSGGERT